MASRDSAGVARRSAWLVVIPVVLAALVALVLSLLSTPLYRATAEVLTDVEGGRGLDTEAAVASGSELLAEVRAVVGDEPELSVGAAGAPDVLEFTATSTNADNAATAANVHSDVYVARSPGAEVVDRAVAPSDPYSPNVVRVTLLAALAGLVIGIVAALVVRWRDTTIRSERQLTKVTGLANLAVIPRHPLGEVRPDDVAVLRDPNSIESEAYRTLRTVVDFVSHDHAFTVLLVTSPRPGEGKSSVAANLAASVAQSGRKVVLVDGDLRRPQVHRLFVTGNERGLSSVLNGEEPLKRCVQRIDRDHAIGLLTAGPPPPDPAELLTHDRLRRALASLAGAADLVVIDAPPVLPVADPIILAQVADATLLVATAGFSDRKEWTETLDRLRKVDADVIGTVLLRPDSRVHATPSYRYAPSAAPAHWWVTEASRRSNSGTSPARGNEETAARASRAPTAPPADDDRNTSGRGTDAAEGPITPTEAPPPPVPPPPPTVPPPLPTVPLAPPTEPPPTEPRPTETYAWGTSAESDNLAWLDSGEGAANGAAGDSAHGDDNGDNDDDGESGSGRVTGGDPPAN